MTPLRGTREPKYAKVSTNKGRYLVKLFKDEVPNTVANFAHLADSGFYDGFKFHRVIQGFHGARWVSTLTTMVEDLLGTGGPDWALRVRQTKYS